jgi:hypothetical protein
MTHCPQILLGIKGTIPGDLAAVGEVNDSVDGMEDVESGQVVSKEEEISEDTVAVGCVTSVDMSGIEAPVAVGLVVIVFIRGSRVGLGGIKAEDADAAGNLLHAVIFVGLGGGGVEPTDIVWAWSVVEGDALIPL